MNPEPDAFADWDEFDDLDEITLAGSIFAAAIADITHHEIGEPGCWDCSGTPSFEIDRLEAALERIEAAIRDARDHLAPIARRRGAANPEGGVNRC